MADVSHYFGGDLQSGPTGDLLVADTAIESRQRVLRRLLTNQRDYLWEPLYGAGLPGYIGRPLDQPAISSLIKSQMYLEGDVSHDPEPQVALRQIPNGISAQIGYSSVATGSPVLLNFDLTP